MRGPALHVREIITKASTEELAGIACASCHRVAILPVSGSHRNREDDGYRKPRASKRMNSVVGLFYVYKLLSTQLTLAPSLEYVVITVVSI